MRPPVVVGVDGTSSHEALLWAADAARARGLPLHIVHALWTPMSAYEIVFDEGIEQQAKERLHTQAARVEEAVPTVVVHTELVRDTVARALTQRSEGAALLVVGTHHPSAMERILTGSLTYQIVAGSQCPAVVVPSTPPRQAGGVVVGADGSQDSLAAIAFAAQEADRVGAVLHVVHAWQEPAVFMPPVGGLAGGLGEQMEEGERLVLAESVAGLADKYPDLHVHQLLVRDTASNALLRLAQDARLLVVGSRGRTGIQRMLLGSVSHTVVLHTPCPLAVVRR